MDQNEREKRRKVESEGDVKDAVTFPLHQRSIVINLMAQSCWQSDQSILHTCVSTTGTSLPAAP